MKQNLIKIEKAMDEANANYGSELELCIYCKAVKYNSIVGIVHYEDCPVLTIRHLIGDYHEMENRIDR